MTPNADPAIVKFVLAFCRQNLKNYGVNAIYLFGSRARGTQRPNSDHDFLVVVSDNAPPEITTGGTLHSAIFDQLNTARYRAGLGEIDLVILRASFFAARRNEPGTFANAAATEGILLV